MSIRLKKTVGIACLSFLLQVGANSQSTGTPNASQDHTSKTPDTITTTSSSINQQSGRLAMVSDPAGSRAKSDAGSEKSVTASVREPKVNLKYPRLDLPVKASESKLSASSFGEPDLEILGDPKDFRATAYALYGRTRSGAYVRRGVIAADPRVLPLGTIVQLKAGKYSGVYTVHDTGGKIKGNIIDVWVPSNKEARIFGRRKVKLHVLRLGPAKKVKKSAK